jgi:hypothetical protein
MPLLNSTYLSNWYKLTLPGYGEVLAESFTQSKVQEAQNKGMIQGDIGVRVMDVGTLYYTSTVSGPILVAETTEFYDIFGLITSNVDLQRLALSGTNSNIAYLLKNAQIQISTEQVRATATFEGDYALDVASYNPTGSVDLLARTARFYDTTFYFGSVTDTYAVISGDININFDLDRNFFLGQGQAPYFSIRGYNSTGNVKIALTPSQYTSLSAIVGSFENSGFLNYNSGNIGVTIADNGGTKNLNLGTAFVITKIEFSMQQNSIITATLEFNAFFNSSASLTSFSQNV